MNYLLDTHTFLWTISNTANLSAKAAEIIKNPKNEIFVSAVSFWEISIKRMFTPVLSFHTKLLISLSLAVIASFNLAPNSVSIFNQT